MRIARSFPAGLQGKNTCTADHYWLSAVADLGACAVQQVHRRNVCSGNGNTTCAGRAGDGDLENVQTWDNGKFDEIDLDKWVRSSPNYLQTNKFAGVPASTISKMRETKAYTWESHEQRYGQTHVRLGHNRCPGRRSTTPALLLAQKAFSGGA